MALDGLQEMKGEFKMVKLDVAKKAYQMELTNL